MRTAVGLLAVTLEIVLILLLVGLTNGGIADSGDRIAGVGGEIIFKSADSSYVLGMNNAILPVSMADDIAKVEGVKVVAPIVAQTEVGGGFTMIWGVDPQDVRGDERWHLPGSTESGSRVRTKPSLMIGIAADKKLKVGSPVEILKRPFTVSGIVQNGKGRPRVYSRWKRRRI